MKKYPYLNNSDFLSLFDGLQLKEQFVKIIVLDFLEKPLQEIQGQVVSGSINIDGQSSVRRTCTITFIAKPEQAQVTNINNLLSINKKVKIEIGFTNATEYYKEYKKLWFPLGTYLIINPSISNSNGGIQITLQLKDKMCLLNGECGGVIPAAVDFANMEQYDEKGNLLKIKPTIYQIIQELVNHYGGEQLGKILINGLDKKVKQVVKWQGNKPIYYYEKKINNSDTYNACSYTTNSTDIFDNNTAKKDIIYYQEYNVGEDIGYQLVDFVYPDELAVDAGATVCSVLDTIKDKLGNFEYFYDLEGNFVFQEIKNYLNTTPTSTYLNEKNNFFRTLNKNDYLVDRSKGITAYRFSNKNIITSYANTPQYNMIKNDFIVWGIRKTLDGLEFPIRYHLAIDSKPKLTDEIFSIYFEIDEDEGYDKPFLPQRVFSQEDFKCTSAEDFKEQLEKFVPESQRNPDSYFVYEFYYTGEPVDGAKTSYILKWDSKKQKLIINPKKVELTNIKINDWRSMLYIQGLQAKSSGQDAGYYYTELMNEWPKIYNLRANAVKKDNRIAYYIGDFRQEAVEKFTNLDYFLDFIEPSSAVGGLSVSQIGRRTKVLNDNSVNCIFEPKIPDYILIKKGVINKDYDYEEDKTAVVRADCIKRGYKYLQVDDYTLEGLGIGGHYNSAFNAIQDLLYQHTSYNESITINCLPIYHLEPNVRIFVSDKNSDIQGDYVIKSMSLPLDINGTMTITASKVLDKI